MKILPADRFLQDFYKIIVSLSVGVVRHAESTKSNTFTISLQYFKENVKDEVDVLPADECWRFLQSDTIILVACDHACPNTQKNKFAISLQHVKKERSCAVDFLFADKHESLLQIDTKFF